MPNEIIPFEWTQQPEDAREQLTKIADIDHLVETSKNVVVTDEQSAKQALSMALQSRKLEKTLEESRLEIVRPHLGFQRAVNKIVKDFKDKLQAIECRLHTQIIDWIASQKDNPFTAIDSIAVEDGMIYTKTGWDFHIENETIIPREFCLANHNLIETAIKNGVRTIPGVKIYSTETSILRIKNS